MKGSFRQKLIVSFLVIFTVFTAGTVVFVQHRARQYKTEALQERLDAYADEVSAYLQLHSDKKMLDSLLLLMPDNLRLTLVDRSGNVLFDNAFPDLQSLENHAGRPEIVEALSDGAGSFIRTSASNQQPYLYYAKDNGDAVVVRVALPYDIRVKSFLQPDNAFLYFVIALFLAGLLFIVYVGNYFGKSVRHLRDFSATLNSEAGEIEIPAFPKDELGEIGRALARDFTWQRENKKQLSLEREKLLLHIQTLAEGVCFFNPDRTVAFYNGLFLQYFNMLYAGTLAVGGDILADNFPEAAAFLENRGADEYYETRILRHGKEFLLRLNVFEDESFEIILTDVTARARTRRLKQEMTGNIAHELRTPVTSIRGFLETILENNLGEAKTRAYLERAYAQTKTLSELIADMSLLTRLDEKQDSFGHAAVEMDRLIEKVRTDTAAAMAEKNIIFTADLPTGLKIRGNESLLYSIFRNLTDNAVRHAGENIAIRIGVTGIRDGVVHFSFADTGRGIADEQHLNRLFERFYRVGEGRTRDTGGSGLGLSIVKNAIQFHGGHITVRNREAGGLEFLFTLPL